MKISYGEIFQQCRDSAALSLVSLFSINFLPLNGSIWFTKLSINIYVSQIDSLFLFLLCSFRLTLLSLGCYICVLCCGFHGDYSIFTSMVLNTVVKVTSVYFCFYLSLYIFLPYILLLLMLSIL